MVYILHIFSESYIVNIRHEICHLARIASADRLDKL